MIQNIKYMLIYMHVLMLIGVVLSHRYMTICIYMYLPLNSVIVTVRDFAVHIYMSLLIRITINRKIIKNF